MSYSDTHRAVSLATLIREIYEQYMAITTEMTAPPPPQMANGYRVRYCKYSALNGTLISYPSL